MEVFSDYSSAINALGAFTALAFLQLFIADITGIRNSHLPGSTVETNHKDFFFRSVRTVANTNESIGIFICALLLCILSSASPALVGYAAWAYAISRSAYTLAYYANQSVLRPICFAISLLSILSLIVIGLLA